MSETVGDRLAKKADESYSYQHFVGREHILEDRIARKFAKHIEKGRPVYKEFYVERHGTLYKVVINPVSVKQQTRRRVRA